MRIATFLLVFSLIFSANVIAGPTCPPIGAPLTVKNLDMDTELVMAARKHSGDVKSFTRYIYTADWRSPEIGYRIDLSKIQRVILFSAHIPGICDVAAEMTAVTIFDGERSGWLLEEHVLGVGSPDSMRHTLHSLAQVFPEYEAEDVEVLNWQDLPRIAKDTATVLISGIRNKSQIHLTRNTVAIILDGRGDQFSMTLFSGGGMGAPSLNAAPAMTLNTLPKEVKNLLSVGVSAQGKMATTWGAIKSRK